jgi:isochorismate hydrolase
LPDHHAAILPAPARAPRAGTKPLPLAELSTRVGRLADRAVAEALAATGRRQLITAGIGSEVCGAAPALNADRDGYQVAFVADACRSATALGHDISLRRLEQEGITLITTTSVSAESRRRLPQARHIMRG